MKKETFNEKQLLSRKDLKKVLGGDPGVTERDCPEGQYKHYCPGGFIGEDGVYQHINVPLCAYINQPPVCGDGSGGGGGGGGPEPGTTT